jgi:hypothetical protein
MGTPSKIAQKVANGALGVNMEHTLNSSRCGNPAYLRKSSTEESKYRVLSS